MNAAAPILFSVVLWGGSVAVDAQAPKVNPPPANNATQPRGDANASQAIPQFDPAWVGALQWRAIGPASVGGRIVDLAVAENDPVTFYIATASGGVFKTTNSGTTFAPVFEKQATASIGDMAVAPSNPDIIWVGTGEHNARNSVSWGDGVYKSTDGGKSWQNMGLRQSFQIGRIAIHPTNPDIVYVGALGRLWGPNEERGLYQTTDGGKSWAKILHVDDKTGCVEVQMHPTDPATLLVAMYERQRDIYCVGDPAKRWGPGSGLYKTTDGGKHWNKLSKGLPTRPMGRIGVAYHRKNPKIVFAIIETDKIGEGPASAHAGISGGSGAREAVIQQVIEKGPAAKAGVKVGDIVQQLGGKPVKTYEELVLAIRDYKPGDKVKLVVKRGEEMKELELVFATRDAGGKPFGVQLGGQAANADKQQGKDGFETGGVFRSEDGGDTWQRVNSLNPRPFYYSQIQVDPSDDRFVYVLGIQFHYSADGGKTFQTAANRVHPDHHALWIDPRDGRHLRLGCDGGFYVSHDRGRTWDFHDVMDIAQFYDIGVDTRRAYWVYGGLQDNGSWGAPSRKRGATGPENADWLRIGGGDGFVCRVDPEDANTVYCEMQYGRISRVNVATGERVALQPPGQGLRFNWKTPMLLSPHNSKIFYCAGNHVFGSLNRGANLQRLSPDITRTDKGSATALAESPRESGVLWVGTDDGALWISRDGGRKWDSVMDKVGLPTPYHVASIEPSRFAAGRAYVAFDGHRSNSEEPHVFVTEDYGRSWRSLRANLPAGSARVLREDVANENLLYCGTEFGVWATSDRGRHWARINNNLPTVAVHEIAVHPTAGEIVAATHGRGVWVLEVASLRQFTTANAKEPSHLFAPESVVLWAGALSRSNWGNRFFAGQNPAFGAAFHYRLSAEAKSVSLEIRNARGETLKQFTPQKKSGLHSVQWDLRAGERPRTLRPGPAAGTPVKPGVYIVRLVVDGREYLREIDVQADPAFPAALLQQELEESVRKMRPQIIE